MESEKDQDTGQTHRSIDLGASDSNNLALQKNNVIEHRPAEILCFQDCLRTWEKSKETFYYSKR